MKFINRKFVWLILSLIVFSAQAEAQEKIQQIVLPVRYDEYRFYVQPVTADNIKLNLFTDTGGGLFIFGDVAEKLKLIKPKDAKNESVDFPVFQTENLIPVPLGSDGKLFLLERKKAEELFNNNDGMLG